ncbi:hypothetical protein [Planctomicrobium sp. SH664]|uniref:hypothetical protein n=1 Tax=Planctomicrobium sp. SH664 TaxID=3448125 RepID=UPI003F5C3289
MTKRQMFWGALLFGILTASHCHADNGEIYFSQRIDDVYLTVYVSPIPVRQGPVDISVLVLDTSAEKVVEDAKVEVTATPQEDSTASLTHPATFDAATNKMLRAAEFDLPHPGHWVFTVKVLRNKRPEIRGTFSVEAAGPAPRWVSFWPWFTWPLVLVGLFVLYQWLASRDAPGPALSRR